MEVDTTPVELKMVERSNVAIQTDWSMALTDAGGTIKMPSSAPWPIQCTEHGAFVDVKVPASVPASEHSSGEAPGADASQGEQEKRMMTMQMQIA